MQIALRREGAEMVLEVADDGTGLDHAAIRRRGEQRGLLPAGTVMGDEELESLISTPDSAPPTSQSALRPRRRHGRGQQRSTPARWLA